MWNALHSYDPLKGPLDYWLKYKAKMAMLHFLKPKEYLDGGGKEVPTSEFVEHEGFYEEDLILAYHYGEIHEAVDRLPLRQKTVVYQRYWLDWKKPDFIEHYGYDPSSDLSRAKKSLRGELAHLAGAA
jgi:DNA-directed RNA polymerase specialized sigma24 family protein